MVTDKEERIKKKADYFLEKDVRVIVKTYNKDFYFLDILLVGENSLIGSNFTGKRVGEKTTLLWFDVYDIEEFKEYSE